MAFHNLGRQGKDEVHIGAAKFIEPLEYFVVGDSAGYIHVYSYLKGDKLQRFRAHTGRLNSLAIHPTEPFVLSASSDKLIKLWNWETGWQCIRTFKEHLGNVYRVRFNPQTMENTFVSSSGDSTLKIWNIHSPTPVATLHCNFGNQSCLDYFIPSDDRQYLVTFSSSSFAQIWDLQTNTVIRKIEGLQMIGCSIAVVESLLGHPILLTVSEDHNVSFCDSATHRVNFNLGTVWDVAYIKMIKSLAIAYNKGIVIKEID